MLVLSRKAQEEIVIITPQGEEITLKVIKIGESNIKIGLDANPDYQIVRGEIFNEHFSEHRELALNS